MSEYINFHNPVIQLPKYKYDVFCQQLKNVVTIANLDIFKDPLTCDRITKLCADIFFEELEKILYLLDQINLGIAALDIPETKLFDAAFDTVYGAAVIIGIFNNIGKSNFDLNNSTPFTLHTASHTSGELLQSKEHTPDAKLGFHNDGLLSSGNLEIPKHIVIYNLYLAYRRPGMFRWVPTALWDEANSFGEKIKSENIKIKIGLTPYFNLNNEGSIIKTGFDTIEIPVSYVNKEGQRQFFLNGKVLQQANQQKDIDLIKMIQNSLQNNPTKISIEQKERRAFFLKNTNGFHARDIFEDAIEGVDLTRVYLRSVDINSEIYPSNRVEIDEAIV